MVETADATTSRVGVSSQGAGLGATADACPVPDADPLGQCTAGSSTVGRGTACVSQPR